MRRRISGSKISDSEYDSDFEDEKTSNDIFVYGINMGSEEMIKKPFSVLGRPISFLQRDECYVKFRYYSKEQKETLKKKIKSQFWEQKIVFSEYPLPSLIIMRLPPEITGDTIIRVLDPLVHPIQVNYNNERATCIIVFANNEKMEIATRYLLENNVGNHTLRFAIYSQQIEKRKKTDTQIQKKMQEAGIPSKITQRIVSNLSQYQIDFLNREEKVLEKLISQYKNPSSKKNFICFIIFIVIVIIFLVYFVL